MCLGFRPINNWKEISILRGKSQISSGKNSVRETDREINGEGRERERERETERQNSSSRIVSYGNLVTYM